MLVALLHIRTGHISYNDSDLCKGHCSKHNLVKLFYKFNLFLSFTYSCLSYYCELIMILFHICERDWKKIACNMLFLCFVLLK